MHKEEIIMDKIVNKGIDDFFEKWVRTTKLRKSSLMR